MSFIVEVNEIYAKMNSIITSIDAVIVLEPIQNEMVSLANDKATLDSLFADKATLDSLFADKATLDSLFADKATLESLFADKSTLDSLFLNLNDIVNVSTNMPAILDASKIINMSVNTGNAGSSVTWDAVNEILTIPVGDTGKNGIDGKDVDHVSKTAGTGASGTIDTYTLWKDSAETISLGNFQVYNGADGSGKGDMLKSDYDINGIGIVDNAQKVNGLTVETSVPLGAKFTDTLTTIVDSLTSTSTTSALSANQGKVIKGLIDNINTLLASDDTTLDQIQEIVDFIKINKSTLDSLAIANIAGLQSALDAKMDANLISSSVDFKKPSSGVLFTKTASSDFTIPVGFKLSIGTTAIEVAATQTLSLNTNLDTGTKTAGTDYYVYAKSDSTFYISADKTITVDRLIGGFHYGLVPETEALTGNKTEADMVAIRGINQYSFWDLKFRPVANPDGMVFVNGRWYDIYLLNSEHITNGSSKAGAVIAGGVADTTNYRAIPKIPLEFGGDGATNYGKFTWFQACEIAKSHSKELISYSEFPTIAYGVLENVSAQTNSYEVNVGKVEHYSNLTSKWGIEQASGTQWIWGNDLMNGYGTTSFAWANNTDSRGQIYSTSNSPTAVLLGAARGNGVDAGSRASSWGNYVWNSGWSVGSRFACDHLELV